MSQTQSFQNRFVMTYKKINSLIHKDDIIDAFNNIVISKMPYYNHLCPETVAIATFLVQNTSNLSLPMIKLDKPNNDVYPTYRHPNPTLNAKIIEYLYLIFKDRKFNFKRNEKSINLIAVDVARYYERLMSN